MSTSDERDFEEIYRSIPIGVTIAAARLSDSETLRSFCYSLKGAAIRLGTNAMHFNWQYSKRNWLGKGIQHFRAFVETHSHNGVGLFLIDQPTGYADREVAGLIREFSVSTDIRVIMTVIAGRVRKNDERWLAAIERGAMVFRSLSAISLRGSRLKDGFYSARTVFRGQEAYYGPLYFIDVCPQPPNEGHLQTAD